MVHLAGGVGHGHGDQARGSGPDPCCGTPAAPGSPRRCAAGTGCELLRIFSTSRKWSTAFWMSAGAGFEVRVREQRGHDRPVGLVVLRGRQAHAPVVVLVGEVELVEPVARVVAVAVQGLGAQQVHPGVEERDALAEAQQAHPQVLHAHAVGHGRRGGRLEVDGVEQRLVVVRLDVVDQLLRVGGVAGRLAVVVDLGGGHQVAVAVDPARSRRGRRPCRRGPSRSGAGAGRAGPRASPGSWRSGRRRGRSGSPAPGCR